MERGNAPNTNKTKHTSSPHIHLVSVRARTSCGCQYNQSHPLVSKRLLLVVSTPGGGGSIHMYFWSTVLKIDQRYSGFSSSPHVRSSFVGTRNYEDSPKFVGARPIFNADIGESADTSPKCTANFVCWSTCKYALYILICVDIVLCEKCICILSNIVRRSKLCVRVFVAAV